MAGEVDHPLNEYCLVGDCYAEIAPGRRAHVRRPSEPSAVDAHPARRAARHAAAPRSGRSTSLSHSFSQDAPLYHAGSGARKSRSLSLDQKEKADSCQTTSLLATCFQRKNLI